MTIDEKTFFMEGALKICSYLEIENAMFACLDTIRKVMPVDGMYMQYYEPELNALRIIARATDEGGKRLNGLAPLNPEGKEMMLAWTEVINKGIQLESLILNRPEEHAICRSMLAFHGFTGQDSSLMILTLKVEDTPFGSITMHTLGHDRYKEEHARYLDLLSEPFAIAISNSRKHAEVTQLKNVLADNNRYLHREMLRISGDQVIGREFGLRTAMNMVKQVAEHDSAVLLLGETGVGKDVIANAIHYSSSRSEGPFITVNCGAIPSSLLDSELFGHEKGAFTGALSEKRGRFERADKGTIFLDEVGELTPEAQVRLLRVLQNQEIERVGGSETIRVDIRVIAATNRNLEEMLTLKQFREDLWFRLNVFPILIPPLRARKSDIPALVDHFLEKKSISLKLRSIPSLAVGAMEQLLDYHWPGNVRELENIVERALILNKSGKVSFEMLGVKNATWVNEDKMDISPVLSALPPFEQYTIDYLEKALNIAEGQINGPQGAAKLTGLNPSTLRNKLKKYRIPFGKEKDNVN